MLKHRGELLKEVLHKYSNKENISLSAIAVKAGYDQSSLYRHFEKEDLKPHVIRKYAQAIKYNFEKEFPEFFDQLNVMREPDPEYKTLDITSCKEQLEYWRSKYIKLLEIHNELLLDKLK